MHKGVDHKNYNLQLHKLFLERGPTIDLSRFIEHTLQPKRRVARSYDGSYRPSTMSSIGKSFPMTSLKFKRHPSPRCHLPFQRPCTHQINTFSNRQYRAYTRYNEKHDLCREKSGEEFCGSIGWSCTYS